LTPTQLPNLTTLASAVPDWVLKIQKGSHDPEHAPITGRFSFLGWDLLWSTYTQNFHHLRSYQRQRKMQKMGLFGV